MLEQPGALCREYSRRTYARHAHAESGFAETLEDQVDQRLGVLGRTEPGAGRRWA